MKKFLSFLIFSVCSTFLLADVFMTELTDPQNSSDAGRYVELHNNGDAVVDLSSGWTVQRWTNGNTDPQSAVELTGSIIPGGFYIICNDADKFNATFGLNCDLDIGTGGFADSNGDDNMALLLDGVVVDMFGIPGEDGSGTAHEFEDGRAERAIDNATASAEWDSNGWNTFCDSSGCSDPVGSGGLNAPDNGFDPGAWIGAGEVSDDVYGCMDMFALNYNPDATADDTNCEYADHTVEAGSYYYTPSSLSINVGESVQFNNMQGFHDVVVTSGPELLELDSCSGPCLIGSLTFNTPGTYEYICSIGSHAAQGMVGTITVVDPTVSVTFSVDMTIEGITDDGVSVRVNGGEWFAMDDSDGDLTYSYTMSLVPGEYTYNFFDGWYEDGGYGDCAGGTYGNDRFLTVVDDAVLDTVCWESCDACPAVVLGCMDSSATNYNADATVDDGSCEYDAVEAANLFISEAAEGSSNNKYLEIYNASDETVSLSNYAYPTVGNAPTVPGEYEFWNSFADGASVAPGDVYVICHGSSDEFILAQCDEFYTYMSNGDDGLCLVAGSEGNYSVLDCVGDWNGDPGSGWDVAGTSSATANHTLVRKSSVTSGNADWVASAGTNVDDSEWVVFEQNTWDYLGSHPHEFDAEDILGCMDSNATNYNADATMQEYNEFGTSTCTYESCSSIPDNDPNTPGAQGCFYDDGTSAGWIEGWWNCLDWGGQVCGLEEVNFVLNLPSGIEGTPHLQGNFNGWCGDCGNAMSSNDDGSWSITQYFSEGQGVEYKFSIGAWVQEETVPADCANNFTNRFYTGGAANTSTTLTTCWGTCEETCPLSCEEQGLATCDDGSCETEDGCPEPLSGILFSNSFGGAVYDGSYGYEVPSGSESWAGFANGDESLYPFSFPNGGTIEFTGSVPTGESMEVFFKFEANPYPDIEPSFQAESVLIAGSEPTNYSVSFGSQGGNTFNNFLLYLGAIDMLVSISDVTVTGNEDVVGDCGDGVCSDNEDCSTCPADCGECQEYSVTFGFDGLEDCGQVNITGTWDNWSGWGVNPADHPDYTISLAAGDYEFKYLCVDTSVDGWWDDVWGNSVDYGAPLEGECWNGNYEYANYAFSVNSDMTISYCAGTCEAECTSDSCSPGDVNDDLTVDVLDVVAIVGTILDNGEPNLCADMNADGTVDVLDVVSIVSIILGNRMTSDATEARLNINDGIASLDANGFVGAVQMTLSHEAGFSIELTNKAMVADYRTNGNSTTLIIVAPDSDELFTASGSFNVEEVIVANENSQVTVMMPTELTLSKAYPNPFNPSTSMNIYVPADGIVSLNVYNVMGQEVATLHSGNMSAGNHTVTWNASNMTSGMYFVRAESQAGVAVQKVMLMK